MDAARLARAGRAGGAVRRRIREVGRDRVGCGRLRRRRPRSVGRRAAVRGYSSPFLARRRPAHATPNSWSLPATMTVHVGAEPEGSLPAIHLSLCTWWHADLQKAGFYLQFTCRSAPRGEVAFRLTG